MNDNRKINPIIAKQTWMKINMLQIRFVRRGVKYTYRKHSKVKIISPKILLKRCSKAILRSTSDVLLHRNRYSVLYICKSVPSAGGYCRYLMVRSEYNTGVNVNRYQIFALPWFWIIVFSFKVFLSTTLGCRRQSQSLYAFTRSSNWWFTLSSMWQFPCCSWSSLGGWTP